MASAAMAPAGMSDAQVVRQAWASSTSKARCPVMPSGSPMKGQLRETMEAKQQRKAAKAAAAARSARRRMRLRSASPRSLVFQTGCMRLPASQSRAVPARKSRKVAVQPSQGPAKGWKGGGTRWSMLMGMKRRSTAPLAAMTASPMPMQPRPSVR